MKLLTLNTAKMNKSIKYGYISAILNLAAAMKYHGTNTCPHSTKACRRFCLKTAGLNRFNRAVQERKTKLLIDNPEEFFTLLNKDLKALLRLSFKHNRPVTCRLNGLSDIPWEDFRIFGYGSNVFEAYPEIHFIDYTKNEQRALNHSRFPISNYSLTYSHSEESNPKIEQTLLSRGMNIAVVFLGDELPKTFKIGSKSYPVYDGDMSDLRHLDPSGVVMGLRYKDSYPGPTGKAKLPVLNGFIN